METGAFPRGYLTPTVFHPLPAFVPLFLLVLVNFDTASYRERGHEDVLDVFLT